MPSGQVIGIDAGGTKLLGGVVDGELRVGQRVHRRWRGGGRDQVIDTIVDAVGEARASAPAALAVGFGIPSLIDFARGHSISSVHLPLDDVPFAELMRERIDLPIFVDNDANLAVLAEQRHGAARGARNVALLTIGTGIGGGLVLDGRVYRGATGAGAELGHMTVDVDGPPCQGKCPNRGCLEVLASGQAIGREGQLAAAREPDSALGRALTQGEPITGQLVTELALERDGAARGVLRVIGERLGAGIVSIVNAFNPEVVVVGGGAAAGGDLLLEPAREVVAARALRPSRDQVRIVRAHFGEEAGMIGAATFAFERGRA